jgi:hypothetical protein
MRNHPKVGQCDLRISEISSFGRRGPQLSSNSANN